MVGVEGVVGNVRETGFIWLQFRETGFTARGRRAVFFELDLFEWRGFSRVGSRFV